MSEPHGRPTTRPSDAAVPLEDPRVRRLLWIGALSVLSLMALPRLLAPLALGWQRAERTLILEEELQQLQRQHLALQQEIEYRRTPAGQALTAAEVLTMTYPRGRVVDLVPTAPGPQSVQPPTLGERVKVWREKGRTCLCWKWRVLNLLLLDRRLPAGPSL